MVKSLSIGLGVGLVILGLSELTVQAQPWLTASDFVAAVIAFGIVIAFKRRSSHFARISSLLALALGLFALSLISFKTGGTPSWQSWWNFAFAWAFLLAGLEGAYPMAHYKGELGAHGYAGPYAYHSGGAFGAGYPYSWRPYIPMGGYDEFQNPVGHSGRGPRSYRRSDLRIEEDVNDQLTHHWEVDASDILVEVKAQEVVLRGQVDSRRARRIAEAIAESVPGVKEVKNDLQVRGKDTTTSSIKAA